MRQRESEVSEVSHMPGALRELIDSAEASDDWDAVADWCERFDWAQAEGTPAAEFYLELAAAATVASGQQPAVTRPQLLEAVAAARSNGASWGRIGEILGVTSEEAQKHYAVSTDARTAAAP